MDSAIINIIAECMATALPKEQGASIPSDRRARRYRAPDFASASPTIAKTPETVQGAPATAMLTPSTKVKRASSQLKNLTELRNLR